MDFSLYEELKDSGDDVVIDVDWAIARGSDGASERVPHSVKD
jgi:hypothetical protein